MITALRVELLKMKRSLALPIAIGAPVLTVVLGYLLTSQMGNGRGRMGAAAVPWGLFVNLPLGLWAFFMLPMAITGLVVMTSQVEHGPKAWNYVLSLPTARWQIFLSKALVVLGFTALMTVLIYLLLPASGALRDLTHKPLQGQYDWAAMAKSCAKIYAGGLLLTVIQIWASLRFRNMAMALAVGIGGGVVSIAFLMGAMIVGGGDAGLAVYFPWLIPANTMNDKPEVAQTLWFGLFGGLAALGAMIADLSRREVA